MSSRIARVIDRALEASIVGSFTNIGSSVRSHLDHWENPASLEGRIVVLTGATSGIGRAAATMLVNLGAELHIVGRSADKVHSTVDALNGLGHHEVTGHLADLALLHDTARLEQTLHETLPRIDVLIHNAGALLTDFTATTEGIETTVVVHLLSPILLTERLMDCLSASSVGRVIVMTSGGMYTERFDVERLEMTPSSYRGTVAYARAKRAQTVWVTGANARFGDRVAFHLVHPGWTNTPGVDAALPGFATVTRPFLRSPAAGAADLVWLASTPPQVPAGGQLWLDRQPRPLHRLQRTRLSTPEEASTYDDLMAFAHTRIATALRDQS